MNLSRSLESIVAGCATFLMSGALGLSPLAAQEKSDERDSVFPAFARLNFEAYGDPSLIDLGQRVENARNFVSDSRSPAARYGQELASLAELTALAVRHRDLRSREASKDLLNVVTQGQVVIKAGTELEEYFAQQKVELATRNLDPIFLKRHRVAVTNHLASHDTLQNMLTMLDEAFSTSDDVLTRENLDLLDEWFTINPVTPRSRLSISDDPQNPPVRLPVSRSIERAELDLSSDGILLSRSRSAKDLDPPSGEPTAADLAVTLETPRSAELVALAAELDNSAVKIFNWVHKNIEFDAYVGSRRGAAETLRLRAGNDMDQASLLIALLRAGGIPSRYAGGLTEMTPEAATNWLGTQSATSAGSLLTTAGMEGITINDGNEVAAIRCRRIWVEAYVPFTDYRGTGASTGEKLWVPLDPAFKTYKNEFGLDLPTETNLPVDAFLTSYFASTTPSTVVEEFEADLLAGLANVDPPKTVAENSLSREIDAPDLPWLPASLPNRLISLDSRFSAISDIDRFKIRFLISGEGSTLDKTVFLPEIAGRQLTLSYRGATTADQALISANGGLNGISQPFIVKVVPELKIDGCVVATGTGSVTLGVRQNSQFFFTEPGAASETESFTNVIVAGTYEGLAIDTGRVLVDAENRTLACPENNSGEFQHKLGMRYLEMNDQADRRVAGSFQAVLWKGVSNAILGEQVSVAYSGGTPLTFNFTGHFVDADRAGATPFSAFGNDIFYRFGRIRGAQSSQNENLVFERNLGEDAVSTIKILRVAAERGIPIFEIDLSNGATLIPQLTHPGSTKNDIVAEVNAGKRVTIPRDPLTYFDWSGTGYIQLETVNGTGGYIISGGQSGGATAKKKKKPDCDSVIGTDIQPPMPAEGYTNCDQGVVTISAAITTYNQKECDAVGTRVQEKKFSPSSLAPGTYNFKFGSAGACGCGIKTVTIKIRENEVSYKDTDGRPSIGGILEIAANGSETVTAKSKKADTRWLASGDISPTSATGDSVPFDVNIPFNTGLTPGALLPLPAVTWMIFVNPSASIEPTNLIESCGIDTIVTPFPDNGFELSFDLTEIIKERYGTPDPTETSRSQKLGALQEIINTAVTLKEMSESIGDLARALGSPVEPPAFSVSGKIFVKDAIKEVANSNRVEWTGTLGVAGELGVSGDIPVGSTVALGIPPQLASANIIVPVKAAFGAELSGDLTYRRPASWPGLSVPKAELSAGVSLGIGVQASVAAGFIKIRATGTGSITAKLPITPVVNGRNLKLEGKLEYEVKGLTLQYQVDSFFGAWSTADSWEVFKPFTGPPGGAKPFTVMNVTPE